MERLNERHDGIPTAVTDILNRANEKGIHSLVGFDLRRATTYWKERAPEAFKGLTDGGLRNKDPYPYDGFIIIDESPKPNLLKKEQIYPNDPFAKLLHELRNERKIKQSKNVPLESRFDIPWNEIYGTVLPKIADSLEVDRSKLRLPKMIELAILLSFDPNLGKGDSWEWLDDRTSWNTRMTARFSTDVPSQPLMKEAPYLRSPEVSKNNLGFRPIILV